MDKQQLIKLSTLCRIELAPEECAPFLARLSSMLEYVHRLKEVDTEMVAPCTHVLETQVNVMRDDEVGATMPQETLLANAPSHVGGMIRVPPVIAF